MNDLLNIPPSAFEAWAEARIDSTPWIKGPPARMGRAAFPGGDVWHLTMISLEVRPGIAAVGFVHADGRLSEIEYPSPRIVRKSPKVGGPDYVINRGTQWPPRKDREGRYCELAQKAVAAMAFVDGIDAATVIQGLTARSSR